MTAATGISSVRTLFGTIPTDAPEADGTLAWDETDIVVVEVGCDGVVGTGWTYGPPAVASLVQGTLAPVVLAGDPLSTAGHWQAMVRSLRNIGRAGVASMALSAVDCALWDLKARLLGIPLHRLLGSGRVEVPLYGSGGFTTYDDARLSSQLEGWLGQGMEAVKIKIAESWGTRVERDLARVDLTRDVVGQGVEVFVDANGGYAVGQAVRVGAALDARDVRWFEEPVSSDDLLGLRTVRRSVRADVTAGEYGFDLDSFQSMAAADCVDCLQVDVTRCGGVTELLRIASVAAAAQLEVSGHCAPYQHAAAMAAVPNLRHLEFFHDHVRIEQSLFDGWAEPARGRLPLGEGPGHGLAVRPGTRERFERTLTTQDN